MKTKIYKTALLAMTIFTLLSFDTRYVFPQNVNVTPNPVSYSTLMAAFTAINAGTHGAGAITVTIVGNTVETAAAQLNGGVFTSCTISPVGARTVTRNSNGPIISFNGADNVTVDGLNSGGDSLTMVNTNAGLSANGIQYQNGSTNNSVRNLTLIGTGASGLAGGRGISILQSSGTVGNNDNTIENCTIIKFRIGVQINGSGLNPNERAIIRNCKIKNFTQNGMLIGPGTRDNLVELNDVFHDTEVVNATPNITGIEIRGCGSEIVRRNKIYSLNGTLAAEFTGIISFPQLFSSPLVTPTTKVEIHNNMIALNNCISTAPVVIGIFATSFTNSPNSKNYTVNIYFNSIRIAGSSGTTPGVVTTGLKVSLNGMHGPDTARIYNNLCINQRTGGDESSLHIGSDLYPAADVSIESNNNTYFASDTLRGWDAGYDGSLFRGAEGNNLYQSSICEAVDESATAFDNVNFTSETDLHLAGRIAGNMDAVPSEDYLIDIDGDSRALTSSNPFTYRGADERLPSGGPVGRKVVRKVRFSIQGVENNSRAAGQGIGGVDVGLKKKPGGQLSLTKIKAKTTFAGSIGFRGLDANIIELNLNCGDSISAATYEIVLNLPKTITTFCSAPVSFAADTGTYDFTDSLSRAYGNNMYGTSAPFQIYTGDVNKDDVIDASDLAEVENDISNSATGCGLGTDVNFDKIVDATDISIVENNAANSVAAVYPPETLNPPFTEDHISGNKKEFTKRKPIKSQGFTKLFNDN